MCHSPAGMPGPAILGCAMASEEHYNGTIPFIIFLFRWERKSEHGVGIEVRVWIHERESDFLQGVGVIKRESGFTMA